MMKEISILIFQDCLNHFTNKKVEALLAHKLPKIDLVNKSGVPYTAGLDILPEPHEFNGRKYPAFKTQRINKK